jgi:hypothetical protein
MSRSLFLLVALTSTLGGCKLPTPQIISERQVKTHVSPAPSAKSQALADYYSAIQADLLAKGLLRKDRGGADTPFSANTLERNFVQLAFYDEYARGKGFQRSTGKPGRLRRWAAPVRVSIEFGTGLSPESQKKTIRTVQNYLSQLSRITGHPISADKRDPNFHIFFMGEDDRSQLIARILEIVPNINPESTDIINGLPRSIHCLVFAFSDMENRFEYTRAIALVRNEHPDLLRTSCIHEEIAQGLGLANDSPQARPSIFNDDDEFAILTLQDELLLKLLYHPKLKTGMDLHAARPIVQELAKEFTRQ